MTAHGFFVDFPLNEKKSVPKHFILINTPKNHKSSNRQDSPYYLKSKSHYNCKSHPTREAYCLCAKCGSFICENCCNYVGGRRYCENCLIQDDGLIKTFEDEITKSRSKTTPESAGAVQAAPQKVSDLPRAFLNICADSMTFFKTAKDSPFFMTYIIAVLAILPANILTLLLHYEELYKGLENGSQFIEIMKQMPLEMRCASALLASLFQILLLDLIFFACIRGISHAKMSFKETSSVFHYCTLPLLLTGVGTAYDIPVISFIGLCLMILMLTTAVRSSTKCTFLQGTGIMLLFILISTLTGLLHFYGI